MATKELTELLELASKIKMSPQEQEQQRRSFAYGNTKVENRDITLEAIDSAASIVAADDSYR